MSLLNSIPSTRYKVQMFTIFGWQDQPLTFATVMEAEEEIADLISSAKEAGMDDYSREDYRVVPVEGEDNV